MNSFSKYSKSLPKIVFIFAVAIFIVSCSGKKRNEKKLNLIFEEQNDLQRIKDTGILKAVVYYNSTNYFVYLAKPKGFKYDMMK